jgi:hypothetical protein
MPSIENAKWNPPIDRPKGKKTTISRQNLDSMEVGECKRIEHDDLACKQQRHSTSNYRCSLLSIIRLIHAKSKRTYQAYHEKEHIAVVKRIR